MEHVDLSVGVIEVKYPHEKFRQIRDLIMDFSQDGMGPRIR